MLGVRGQTAIGLDIDGDLGALTRGEVGAIATETVRARGIEAPAGGAEGGWSKLSSLKSFEVPLSSRMPGENFAVMVAWLAAQGERKFGGNLSSAEKKSCSNDFSGGVDEGGLIGKTLHHVGSDRKTLTRQFLNVISRRLIRRPGQCREPQVLVVTKLIELHTSEAQIRRLRHRKIPGFCTTDKMHYHNEDWGGWVGSRSVHSRMRGPLLCLAMPHSRSSLFRDS